MPNPKSRRATTRGDVPMRSFLTTTLLCVLAALASAMPAGAAPLPKIGHVFVIVLENENADVSFGPDSPAPYLAEGLPARGVFIPNYYGVTHESLGNYVAMVSGQGANPQTQADCQ